MPNTRTLSKYLTPDQCKDGDVINFMGEGTIEEKTFTRNGVEEKVPSLDLPVEINGEKKLYSPNATSRKLFEKAWGFDTPAWIGKQARITIVPASNGKDSILAKPVV